jgi:hypothetical protein
MIRTIVTPDEDNIMLSIPKNYVGEEIEVIVFSREEGFQMIPKAKRVTFNSLSIDTRNFKFNRDEANER